MGILWALAGPGTVLGVGGAVVLGLNSHAAPTKEAEYTVISCEVVTSLSKKERQETELEGEAGDGGSVFSRGLELRPRGVGIREKSLPAEGGNGFGLFTEQPGGHCAWSTVMGVEELWPKPNLPDYRKNLGFWCLFHPVKRMKVTGDINS